MGLGDRYCNRHVFPIEMNEDAIKELFFHMDETIGSRTELTEGGNEDDYCTIGLISKMYNDGLAYLELTFEERGEHSPDLDKKYHAVNFAASTHYDKRRKITARLDHDITTFLKQAFDIFANPAAV